MLLESSYVLFVCLSKFPKLDVLEYESSPYLKGLSSDEGLQHGGAMGGISLFNHTDAPW